MADIGDQLATLVAASGRSKQLARTAIACELDVEQLVARSNPEAIKLYDEACRRGIKVAFTADSYLPRDFVAKLLQLARFRSDLVLVSSHEGATKASGNLFEALSDRAGVAPERIVHVGPDHCADLSGPEAAGCRGWLVTLPRARVETSMQLGLTNRTGLDSVALAMAADRLAEVGRSAKPADIGYYAGGPLAAGFATWIDQLIEDQRPDHVVFCGPAGGLLRQLVTTLNPDLPRWRLHDLARQLPSIAPDAWGDPSLAQLEHFVTSLGLEPDDRLLAVDLGWNQQPHTWLWEGLKLLGCTNQVDTAVIGLVDRPRYPGPFQIWAFGADPASPLVDLARERTEVLDALLPDLGPARSGDATAIQLAAGIRAFAEDLGPWLTLGQRQVTAALVEPALRIMHSPTYAEAQLVGSFPARTNGHNGQPSPLATLPPRTQVARDPHLLHRAEGEAPWPQGYRVLAAGDPATSSTRFARRVVRRRVR
jgi:hypothetical protein